MAGASAPTGRTNARPDAAVQAERAKTRQTRHGFTTERSDHEKNSRRGQRVGRPRYRELGALVLEGSEVVNVAVRDETPHSDDAVITTLLLRVARDGSAAPDNIAVELDIGDHHETFSGSRP